MSASRQRRLQTMANTFSQIYFHIVFSTKNRVDHIGPDIEQRVWAYIGGIARKHGLVARQVGGIDNHIHALISSTTTHSPSQIAKCLKGESSSWIHKEFHEMRGFAWQDGYGVFSVSKSAVPNVIEYIKNQRVHHQKQTFEEEFVELLRLHEIEYDERYFFG
ncbi:MAG TPA: IS200/IS605 family transposase [Pyrinomonadaceae bacterium]|nr:IS200/IS605 family transposase [Pyrinomonadaceae bacterium]